MTPYLLQMTHQTYIITQIIGWTCLFLVMTGFPLLILYRFVGFKGLFKDFFTRMRESREKP